LIENVDFKRMGKRQGILLTPIGTEKIIKTKRNSPQDFEKHYIKWKNKEETVVEIAKLLNINIATFYRFKKLYELKLHREQIK
jgi:DNA invertase Pin-like site-specific DNA recombinase